MLVRKSSVVELRIVGGGESEVGGILLMGSHAVNVNSVHIPN